MSERELEHEERHAYKTENPNQILSLGIKVSQNIATTKIRLVASF